MSDIASKEARVSIVLEINKALSQVDSLQSKLNKLSINNISVGGSTAFDKIEEKLNRLKDNIKKYEDVVKNANTALKDLQQTNKMDFGLSSKAVKDKTTEIKALNSELDHLKDLYEALGKLKTPTLPAQRQATGSAGTNATGKQGKAPTSYAEALRLAEKEYDTLKYAFDNGDISKASAIQDKAREIQDLRQKIKELHDATKLPKAQKNPLDNIGDSAKEAKEKLETFESAYNKAKLDLDTYRKGTYTGDLGLRDLLNNVYTTREELLKWQKSLKIDNGDQARQAEIEKFNREHRTSQQILKEKESALATYNARVDYGLESYDENKWQKLAGEYKKAYDYAQGLKKLESKINGSYKERVETLESVNKENQKNLSNYILKNGANNYDSTFQQLLKDAQDSQKAVDDLRKSIKGTAKSTKELETYAQATRNAFDTYSRANKALAENNNPTDQERQRVEQLKQAWLNAVKAEQEFKNSNGLNTKSGGKNKPIDIFRDYQSEMAKVAKSAAVIYHNMKNLEKTNQDFRNDSTWQQYDAELKKAIKSYQELNKESVKFTKEIGINHSRGFYDLNHNIDYFLAKFRGRLTYSLASMAESAFMNAGPQFVDAISQYQQNKVNFAQVMPNEFSNNQEAMTDAMRGFIKVASDYGTSVQDVVEAGRLWGRQYKDVSIVQELVRNSTKLSITDNMSLVEVNKALEATMQQYNIQLKDSAQAQAVSGKVVDTWAKLADTAVVTAKDLASATEQSAGAAHQAGVSFDYLQAMIATMSTATGKSGAEIGRSIRSMLVSMNSNKAKKFFTELDIATTELDKDGKVRVRSFEKVIDELMQKLKTYPKDTSNAILAMSGGKYQYNNVMALLKNYEQMQKNLANIRANDTMGWADQQVEMQYATISRQIQALNADLQQLIITLDTAGASGVIGMFIESMRNLVQLLSHIDSTNIQLFFGTLMTYLGGQTVLAIISRLTEATGAMLSFKGVLSALVGAKMRKDIVDGFNAIRTGGESAAIGVKTLSSALNRLFIALTVLEVALSIGTALYNKYKEATKENAKEVEKTTNELLMQGQQYESQARIIDEHSRAIERNTKRLKNGNLTEKEAEQIKRQLTASEEALTQAIGIEGVMRLKNAGYTKEAIDKEIQAFIKSKIASDETISKKLKNDIEFTKKSIENTKMRIKAAETEMIAQQKIAEAQYSSSREKYKEFQRLTQNGQGNSRGAVALLQDSEMEYKNSRIASDKVYNQIVAIAEANKALDSLNANLKIQTDLQEGKVYKSFEQLINPINGDTPDDSIGGKTNKTGFNPTPKAKNLVLQQAYNDLLAQGKIEQTRYKNELKALNDEEEKYGSTLDLVVRKSNLYSRREQELEAEQKKIGGYRNEVIAALDKEIEANQDLANKISYNKKLSIEEKLAKIEVNKEQLQELTIITQLQKELNSVSQEYEKVNTKIIEVNKNIAKLSKSMKYEDIVSRRNKDINYKYNMLEAKNPYLMDTEKDKLALKHNQELLESLKKQKWTYSLELQELEGQENLAIYEEKKEALEQVALEYEKTYSKIRELQEKEAYGVVNTFSNSITSNLGDMILQSKNFGEAIKNVWSDMTNYIIRRLLQIYVYEKLVGLFAGMGGKKDNNVPTTVGGTNVNNLGTATDLPASFQGLYPKTHTGGNIGYPKMHSGGMVENGRKGVVPKLQNNEVIRTLQVGEEVNSVQDRRSNEILGAIALKAMDSKNEQPQNIYITALDSRSFAEYMNDNADILTAVLAKQGALGRR